MTFNPKYALEVLLPLADAAYELPLKVGQMPVGYTHVSTITVDESLVEWQISNIKSSRRNSLRSILTNKRFGCIYYSEVDNTLVVSFRGTYDIIDIIRDFEFDADAYKCIPDYGSVHTGFQHIYFALRDSIIGAIKISGASTLDKVRCILTGHSLGGALSVLAAPDLYYQHILPTPPEVVTFGAPRTGKKDFVDKFNHDIVNCIQIVNTWDFITRIPPLFNGYTHVGETVKIDGGRTLDAQRAHSLELSYIPGVTNLLTS